MAITVHILPQALTVCKLQRMEDADLSCPFWFFARTAEEISLVCETAHVPADTAAREDGWRGMRVAGALDFALIGILSGLTAALAAAQVPVFAVSTYDTDYLLVKEKDLQRAREALRQAGYTVE